MNLEINLPKKVIVGDYREFSSLQDGFRVLNSAIKVKEIIYSEKVGYVGIIYTGSLTESENQNLIKEIKEENKE